MVTSAETMALTEETIMMYWIELLELYLGNPIKRFVGFANQSILYQTDHPTALIEQTDRPVGLV